MNRATLIPLLVTVILPLLWLLAEFKAQKTFRMALGIIAFSCALATIFLMSWVTKISTLQPAAESVHALVDTTISQLEDGDIPRVLAVLRDLNNDYKPITRAQESYLKELNTANATLQSKAALDVNLTENSPFHKETWCGFWNNDSTNWFSIAPNYVHYDIYRDGIPPRTMTSITISEDFITLQFQEQSRFRHTLTLKNKYLAEHEIYNLETKKVEKKEPMWRLVLPTQTQMQYTTLSTNK